MKRHVCRAPMALRGVAAAVICVAAAPVLADLEMYASEFDVPTHFYTVNPATGATYEIGTTRFSPGLDFRHDGTMYASSSSLYTVDPATGAWHTVGLLPDLLVSIAFSPTDAVYGVSNDGLTLYRIDPSTGQSLESMALTGTVHSSGNPFSGEINGIDFGPDGTLYGIGFGVLHDRRTHRRGQPHHATWSECQRGPFPRSRFRSGRAGAFSHLHRFSLAPVQHQSSDGDRLVHGIDGSGHRRPGLSA